MRMGNSHKCKFQKTVRLHWVYKTVLDKGERSGDGVLDFRSENGLFTGSSGRVEHAWHGKEVLAR